MGSPSPLVMWSPSPAKEQRGRGSDCSVLGPPPSGQGGWREIIPKLLAILLWKYNFTTWHLGG